MTTIKHACVPQTLTPEALADWVMTQRVDTRRHVEEIELTEEEIAEFEHSSSLASRAIDNLMSVKKYFDAFLKSGTPYDKPTEKHKPATVTIPPTTGLDVLKKNREYADAQIVKGFKEEVTELYLIPFPETSRMIMVNIVGVEWPDYSRDMTGDEIAQYKPLLGATRKGKQVELSIDGESLGTVSIKEIATIKDLKKQHDAIPPSDLPFD